MQFEGRNFNNMEVVINNEFLAMNQSTVTAFDPSFPPQRDDISFGIPSWNIYLICGADPWLGKSGIRWHPAISRTEYPAWVFRSPV